MCGGCIIKTYRDLVFLIVELWVLCVMSHDRFVVAWAVLALEATQTGSDDLKEIFESHLVEAGHMLVLLDTIVSGAYHGLSILSDESA